MTRLYPHRIRLLGPWDSQPRSRADGGPLPEPGRLTMPCRLPFVGACRLLRRFQWPARIDPVERVWLTFGGVTGTMDVTLNDTALGRHAVDGAVDFDVTALLQPRNQLTVDLETATPAGGLWGETALEVRRSAYLRDVRFSSSEQDVRVTGNVAGSADRPLELYVLFDNATVSYSTLTPPTTFDVTIPAAAPAQVRVELIDGGVVWYAVECGGR